MFAIGNSTKLELYVPVGKFQTFEEMKFMFDINIRCNIKNIYFDHFRFISYFKNKFRTFRFNNKHSVIKIKSLQAHTKVALGPRACHYCNHKPTPFQLEGT